MFGPSRTDPLSTRSRDIPGQGVRKTKKTLVALSLAFLAVSIAAVGFAYATENSASSNASQFTSIETERSLLIDQGANFVLVRANIQQGSISSHFGLWFSTAHGIVLREEFSRNSEIGDNESEANFHLMVAYVSLVEFKDVNGNGMFDNGTDTVVRVMSLRNLTYTVPTYIPITSQDGKHGIEIAANSTASATNFIFGVKADLFGQYAVVDGKVIAPTESKITTSILNFPFKSTSDMVALQVVAVSAYNIEHETSTSESTIRVRSSTAQGFYTSSLTAMVDGKTVTIAPPSTETVRYHAVISVAYPYGTSIIHDPILGIDFGLPSFVDTSLLIMVAIAGVAVAGILVYAGRREIARIFSPKVFSPRGA
jgi:hypothetical protein